MLEVIVPSYPGSVGFTLLFIYCPTVWCLKAGPLLKRKGRSYRPGSINADKEGRPVLVEFVSNCTLMLIAALFKVI
jgi:hypothetical protein